MAKLPPSRPDRRSRHHGDAVLRGAVGRDGAEDAFQETFLAALRAYPELDDDRNLRGLADHDRAAQGDRPPPARGAGRFPSPRSTRPRSTGPSHPTWASGRGRALPPKQRAAVTLRYASDLPHAEIAAALGCSPAAARRSLHEGLKRLRKELA